MTKFSIAVTRSYKKNEEWVEETDWVNLVVWGQMAERVAEQLRKGNKVYVGGRLHTNVTEAPDGKKTYFTEVVVDDYINLSPRAEGGYTASPATTYTAPSEGFGSPEPSQRPAAPAPARAAAPARTSEQKYDDLDDLPF